MSNANGKTEYKYSLAMTNGELTQISILADGEIERETYLKHFLEPHKDADLYFVDQSTKVRYNKSHIVSCKEV